MKIIAITSRLYLREFVLDDANHFYDLNNDKDVIKYTGDPPFKTVSEAERFIKNYSEYDNYGYGRWAVCLKDSDNFIGFCGLKFHPEEEITEVGFRFFKNQWNKGYATESAITCIDYGFSKLNLTEIYAHVHVNNLASQQVIKKCGLHLLKTIQYDGQPTYLYSIKKPKDL